MNCLILPLKKLLNFLRNTNYVSAHFHIDNYGYSYDVKYSGLSFRRTGSCRKECNTTDNCLIETKPCEESFAQTTCAGLQQY